MPFHTSTDAGTRRVTCDPQLQFGVPTVGASRTTVVSVVLAAREGDGVDGIRQGFPHLSAEDIADALAYYVQHREEIDHLIEDYARGGGQGA